MQALSIRTFTFAAALLTAGASANALTIATNALVADSVQAFSQDALDSFDAYSVTVAPLGNATAVSGVTGAFSFPITSITIDSKLAITSGDAKGSALEISRVTASAGKIGLTLANFTINYTTKQVLADTTPIGGTTVLQAPLYDFTTQSALALKYQFPLKITGHEVLGNLLLTETAIDTMVTSLKLPKIARAAITGLDFGTLTQDIAVKFRSKAVSTTLYTPAQ